MKSLFFFKSTLVETANGAHEVLRDLFKGSAGSDAVIGIAYCGIINVTARANVFHGELPPTHLIYLPKYLLRRPSKALPCLASSFAIS